MENYKTLSGMQFSKFICRTLEKGVTADQISREFSDNGYRLSVPAIHRWGRGENLPGPTARARITAKIEKLEASAVAPRG